jgi:hypothetical protein
MLNSSQTGQSDFVEKLYKCFTVRAESSRDEISPRISYAIVYYRFVLPGPVTTAGRLVSENFTLGALKFAGIFLPYCFIKLKNFWYGTCFISSVGSFSVLNGFVNN